MPETQPYLNGADGHRRDPAGRPFPPPRGQQTATISASRRDNRDKPADKWWRSAPSRVRAIRKQGARRQGDGPSATGGQTKATRGRAAAVPRSLRPNGTTRTAKRRWANANAQCQWQTPAGERSEIGRAGPERNRSRTVSDAPSESNGRVVPRQPTRIASAGPDSVAVRWTGAADRPPQSMFFRTRPRKRGPECGGHACRSSGSDVGGPPQRFRLRFQSVPKVGAAGPSAVFPEPNRTPPTALAPADRKPLPRKTQRIDWHGPPGSGDGLRPRRGLIRETDLLGGVREKKCPAADKIRHRGRGSSASETARFEVGPPTARTGPFGPLSKRPSAEHAPRPDRWLRGRWSRAQSKCGPFQRRQGPLVLQSA